MPRGLRTSFHRKIAAGIDGSAGNPYSSGFPSRVYRTPSPARLCSPYSFFPAPFAFAISASRPPDCSVWVGHALAHAGTIPAPIRSRQRLHLDTLSSVPYRGTLNGHAETQYLQEMHFSLSKPTIPSFVR